MDWKEKVLGKKKRHPTFKTEVEREAAKNASKKASKTKIRLKKKAESH